MNNINKKECGMELNSLFNDVKFCIIDNDNDSIKIKLTSDIFDTISFKHDIKEKINSIIKKYTSNYVKITYFDNNYIKISLINILDFDALKCKVFLLSNNNQYEYQIFYNDNLLETFFEKIPNNYNLVSNKIRQYKKQIKTLKKL